MAQAIQSLSGVRFQEVEARARSGHRTWVFWTDKNGITQGRRYGADAIKEAIFGVGTAGRWYLIGSDGCSSIIRTLRMGNTMLRNAKRGY